MLLTIPKIMFISKGRGNRYTQNSKVESQCPSMKAKKHEIGGGKKNLQEPIGV